MPNKPKQEKQRCTICGIRTRRWVFEKSKGPGQLEYPVCIDQVACLARLPQDAPGEQFPLPMEGTAT